MMAVTFALPAESSRFLRLLQNKSKRRNDGISTIAGDIDNRPIEVFHTGAGEKVCRQRMARFLQDRKLDCLISAGFAGALNNQLNVGDLLLAKNFSTADLSGTRSSISNFPIHIADLLTVPSMVDSSEERDKIAQATGAEAVDMETEFIARACAEHSVPLLSLRAISDTPRQPLPAPPSVLFDLDRQRTNAGRLGFYLAKNPPAIWRLISFARQIGRARERLSNGIVTLVREWRP
jgi:adenosylhomocysteine nucleosidase